MNASAEKTNGVTSGLNLTVPMERILSELLQAHNAALNAQRPPWDFAVEIGFLKEAGISVSDVRYLICQELVEHAAEKYESGSGSRAFGKPLGLHLVAASCFILSDRGVAVCRNFAARADATHLQRNPSHFGPLPEWNRVLRQLKLGTVVVKHFRQPARNQESVLAAFQEEGWPFRIDDPLSGDSGQDAVERLHNTIKRLNKQSVSLLHFSSDGMGQGICWKPRN